MNIPHPPPPEANIAACTRARSVRQAVGRVPEARSVHVRGRQVRVPAVRTTRHLTVGSAAISAILCHAASWGTLLQWVTRLQHVRQHARPWCAPRSADVRWTGPQPRCAARHPRRRAYPPGAQRVPLAAGGRRQGLCGPWRAPPPGHWWAVRRRLSGDGPEGDPLRAQRRWRPVARRALSAPTARAGSWGPYRQPWSSPVNTVQGAPGRQLLHHHQRRWVFLHCHVCGGPRRSLPQAAGRS